jgi:hypothetical protein
MLSSYYLHAYYLCIIALCSCIPASHAACKQPMFPIYATLWWCRGVTPSSYSIYQRRSQPCEQRPTSFQTIFRVFFLSETNAQFDTQKKREKKRKQEDSSCFWFFGVCFWHAHRVAKGLRECTLCLWLHNRKPKHEPAALVQLPREVRHRLRRDTRTFC